MSVLDKTLLTTVGAAKYAYNDAHTLATNFLEIALGDNNGADFIPAITDGACVHEVYRANINSLTIDPTDSTIVIVQLVLPANVGGFTVREARVYDVDGVVMYTANPYFIKSLDSSDQNLLFRIKRSSTSAVTLLVDPSITLASQLYVNNAINTHNIDVSAHAAALFATKAGVQNCTYNYADSSSGTSTIAYTATYAPAVTALVDGMELSVDIGIYTNTTTTPTFSPNGLTAHTIVNQGNIAVSIGDLPKVSTLKYDSTALTWVLLNPLISNNFVTKSGLQNDIHNHATAGGTSDAITVTYAPAYAAWVDGMTFFVKITAANTTTTPTVSPNGLTAKTIVKAGGSALSVANLAVGMIAEFKYNATLGQAILQNPDESAKFVPVGTVAPYTGNGAAPTGYVFGDGSGLSRTAYPALFALFVTNAGFTSQTFTCTIASPAVSSRTAHGFTGGERLRLFTTGALPTGLNTTTDYFVEKIDANNFYLTTSVFGVATRIITTGTQSGVHSFLQSLYGLGDGTTTFNAPDFRGLFIRAADQSRGFDTGRGIGTVQKGTVVNFDAGASSAVVGIRTEVTAIVTGGLSPSHTEAGVDVVVGAYDRIVQNESTTTVNNYCANTTEKGYGSSRPMNMALQHIIKY